MRASLILGLGGTGSWTCLYLKQRLLNDQRWSRLDADAQAMTRSDYGQLDAGNFPVWLRAVDIDAENRPVVASLTLDGGTEDITLESPAGDMINYLGGLRDDEKSVYPTIEQWLPRREAAQLQLPEAARFMRTGAGQIRQFGRLAFFRDALSKNVVLSRLSTAIGQLTARADSGGEFTVYVAASVGGGAGSGLLLDVLAYLQDRRHDLAGDVPFRTVLFVVLPGAFKGVLDPDQFVHSRASGRAALRELDRLVNDFRTVELEWLPGRPVRLAHSVADHVYLLDGSRGTGTDSGVQLEGYDPPQHMYAAGIADAIYTHMLPSSGSVIAGGYTNLTKELINAESRNRYSTFGSYLVEYAWEPMLRSVIRRAGEAVLDQLLAQPTEDTAKLAVDYLEGRAADVLTADDKYEPPAPLLSEVLSSREAGTGEIEPSPYWLTAPAGSIQFPEPPTLADLFPDIGWLRTRYGNGQVRDETEALLAEYWGNENAVWERGKPQFHPVANANRIRIERSFRRGLLLATAAVANRQRRVGGVATGLAFLSNVDNQLELFGENLRKIRSTNLQSYQEGVDGILDRMRNSRKGGDTRLQRDYLDAQQALLAAQLRTAILSRTTELIGRLRDLVKQTIRHISGWGTELQKLRESARSERLVADKERVDGNRLPLRRLLPMPDDEVEQRLYSDCVGADTEPPGSHLMTALGKLSWGVWPPVEGSDELVLRHPSTDKSPADRPTPITLGALDELVDPMFAKLRKLTVFELLEMAGVTADTASQELIRGSATLASFNTERQLRIANLDIRIQEPTFVFAHWPASGNGSQLANALKQRLTSMEIDCHDLVEQGGPVLNKIIAFTAKHLIGMEAFNGVEVLNASYRQRRLDLPSPHIMPEEKGAARMESHSETLARAGLIARSLDMIPSSHVAMCRDERFLRYVAAAAAGGAISWQIIDPIENSGRWVVAVDHGPHRELGTEPEFGAMLAGLLVGTDRSSKDAIEAIRAAARTAASDESHLQTIRDFAGNGWKGGGFWDDYTRDVIKVAAAQHVAEREGTLR
jgi:Tubulin like